METKPKETSTKVLTPEEILKIKKADTSKQKSVTEGKPIKKDNRD